MVRRAYAVGAYGFVALLAFAGCVDSRCRWDEDCPGQRVCGVSGRCEYECQTDGDCGAGFRCTAHRCAPKPSVPVTCPAEMVAVAETFCADRYEAARPDATADDPGSDESSATCRAGVLPWLTDDNAVATRACEAAGKRLCTSAEWELACRGPAGTVYGYGDSYEPETCNGIDTFGRAGLKLLPTGSLPECRSGWGAADMNGNTWEHVLGGSARTVRGGAYNCIDSMTLHRCDYVPRSWTPSALGFRCCLSPEPPAPVPDVVAADVAEEDADTSGPGCLDVPVVPPPRDAVDALEDAPPACVSDEACALVLGPAPNCQRAACVPSAGGCQFAALADGTSCDDADPCTLGDHCVAGACAATAALACDDGNPCTDDACVAGTGCVATANTAPCEDGSPCTEGDRCAEGHCRSGLSVCECETTPDCAPHEDADLCNGTLVCDLTRWPPGCVVDATSVVECPAPSGVCLRASCRPETGVCEELAVEDGWPCEDADLCTRGDACAAGVCAGGPDLVSCAPPADPCLAAACVPTTGLCATSPGPDGVPCDDGDPCTGGDACAGGACRPGATDLCQRCPEDMVVTGGGVCVDRYEASRPDATDSSVGLDGSRATSRPGVLPWFPVDLPTGQQACAGAGKRLCTVAEWMAVCAGDAGRAYVYGDTFDPVICNGIDTYCRCGEGSACAAEPTCPFPHCYGVCGADLHVMPTGSFAGCVSDEGAFDVNGNVWELLDAGDGVAHYRGGAYNCIDSERLHACTYDAGTNVSARGFRCCRDAGGAR